MTGRQRRQPLPEALHRVSGRDSSRRKVLKGSIVVAALVTSLVTLGLVKGGFL